LPLIAPQPQPVIAFIALGSNLDDPAAQVARGIDELGALPRTVVKRASSLYRSAPVGFRDQPDFINAVAQVATRLAPRALLDALLALERRHGRVRGVPNGPRTLDLDLLLYGSLAIHEPGLTIPHPRMHERAFVIVPLAEIAPRRRVPGHGTASRLQTRLDTRGVMRMAEARA
jgi:2-amino-4-hydroxy-6-hydroxymethyldihydropteridine diphosphokinase